MADFGWEYPPGMTGNEPELTGIWPCDGCGAGCTDEQIDTELHDNDEGWYCTDGCAEKRREEVEFGTPEYWYDKGWKAGRAKGRAEAEAER